MTARGIISRRAVASAAAGAASALVAAALLAGIVPADAATSTEVVVAMPGPGHTTSWSSGVRNPSGAAEQVFVQVTGADSDSDGMAGLLTVSVSDSRQHVVIPPTPLTQLLGRDPVPVGSVPAGSRLDLTGTVALSRDAGDDLQGRSAAITFRIVATPAAGAGALPDTGSTIAGAAVAGAATLVGAGTTLVLVRERLRRRRESRS